ncbi:hypothetical protein Sjap_022059 [Stephania japonica]|uniref:Uncharacterized protein n=1 Tax=Stephania japonica TaxID=461633 RepID=A0AAP0ERA0_9MAGN
MLKLKCVIWLISLSFRGFAEDTRALRDGVATWYLDLCEGHLAISHGIGLKVQPKQDDLLQLIPKEFGNTALQCILGPGATPWEHSSVLCHQIKSRCPEGVPLGTVFIHPSVIDMLDSAAEDAFKSMNIFRFIGDYDSLINDLVLLLKIYITKSWSTPCNISYKRTMELRGSFAILFNWLVKECEILGSIRVGVHWTPIKMRLYYNHEEEAASISDEELVDGDANIDDEEMADGDANIDVEKMVDANIDDKEMVDANIDDEDEEMIMTLCGGYRAMSHCIALKVQPKQDDLLQLIPKEFGNTTLPHYLAMHCRSLSRTLGAFSVKEDSVDQEPTEVLEDEWLQLMKMRLYCNPKEVAASISDEEMVDGDDNIDDEEMVEGDANMDDEEVVDANIDDEDQEMVDANIDDEDEEMVDAYIDD